jgi:phosphoribosylformimino-5-aminoimidazole carboxamide ribotide isomerase
VRIIPAIDILQGKVVRLTKGKYDSVTEYSSNPADFAKKFEAHGIKHLHVVDLDGAKAGEIINYKILETITRETSLIVDFGGGVKSSDSARIAFECGVAQITGGSIAISNPETFKSWLEIYGSEKIILGADSKNGKIAISGWEDNTEVEIADHIGTFISHKLSYCIATDIERDGMLNGASIEMYSKLHELFPDLKLIASGGIGSISDIQKLIESRSVDGIILGKAIYEGRINLTELKDFIC